MEIKRNGKISAAKKIVKDQMKVLDDFGVVHGGNEDEIRKHLTDIVENNYEERAYILLDNYRNDLIREKLNRSYEITKRRKHNG